MATKKPSGINQIDHEAQYQRLLKEMHVQVTDGAKQATEAARQAILVANTFINDGDKKKASDLLKKMEKDLARTEYNAKRRVDAVTKKADTALAQLMSTRKAELSAAKNAAEEAAAWAKFNKAYLEIEKQLMEKSHQLAKDYAAKSIDLQKSTHDTLKEFQREVAAKQSEQLDKVLEGIDALEAEQRKAFDARKKRVKEEKQKTRAQEIEEELHELDASWVTRNLVRPLTRSLKESAQRKLDTVKRVTGISGIQNFVKNERVRKDRIDELRFEKNQMNTLGALRDRIVGEQARINSVLEAGKSTSSGHTYESLLQQTNAAIANRTVEGGVTGAYDQISSRNNQDRELKALEEIARSISKTGKANAGFGIGDLIALGGVAASALSSALAGFTPGKLFTALKDFSEARFAEVGRGVASVGKMITESKAFRYIEDIYENVKGWMGSKWKNGVSALTSSVTKGVDAVGSALGVEGASAKIAIGAKAIGSTVSSAASSLTGAVGKGVDTAISGAKTLGGAVSKGLEGVASVGRAVAGSPVGKFIGKNLSRLGNVAAIADIVSGIWEEANGKKIDKIDVMDALLNPMTAGRFLGNKFNQLFEAKMHQPFGSWIYDKLNGDPGYNALKSQVGTSSIKGSAGNATSVNSAGVDNKSVQTSSAPSGTAQAVGKTPVKQAASVNTVLSPSSIPDSAWQDPVSGAINSFAFGGM